jgi:hypothetical protein
MLGFTIFSSMNLVQGGSSARKKKLRVCTCIGGCSAFREGGTPETLVMHKASLGTNSNLGDATFHEIASSPTRSVYFMRQGLVLDE